MSNFFSKQWLIYLGLSFCAFLYFASQPHDSNNIMLLFGAGFMGGLFAYVFSIPVQITIWAVRKHFPDYPYLPENIEFPKFSKPEQNIDDDFKRT